VRRTNQISFPQPADCASTIPSLKYFNSEFSLTNASQCALFYFGGARSHVFSALNHVQYTVDFLSFFRFSSQRFALAKIFSYGDECAGCIYVTEEKYVFGRSTFADCGNGFNSLIFFSNSSIVTCRPLPPPLPLYAQAGGDGSANRGGFCLALRRGVLWDLSRELC
jgi:hypothetical protein